MLKNIFIVGILIFICIYLFLKQDIIVIENNSLYSAAAGLCFTCFIIVLKFNIDPVMGWSPKITWKTHPYGTYPMWILGFLSLSFGLIFLSMLNKKNIKKENENRMFI